MLIEVAITVLCGVGLYVSLFMLEKARRAARGELREASVVQTPRARLFGAVPNALLGVWYYPLLAVATWTPLPRPLQLVVFAVVLVAAGTSVLLAYSLLFITRRPCPYCWVSHAINWSLVLLSAVKIWAAGPLR